MAAAETAQSSHEIVLQTLQRNDIRLVPYVPDRVLTPLIKNLRADSFFNVLPTPRGALHARFGRAAAAVAPFIKKRQLTTQGLRFALANASC